MDDVDDEVRDRAALYLRVFKEKMLADTYINGGQLKNVKDYWFLTFFPIIESVFSLAALESKLVAYIKDPAAAEQSFDISSVPKISRVQAAEEVARTLIDCMQSGLLIF